MASKIVKDKLHVGSIDILVFPLQFKLMVIA